MIGGMWCGLFLLLLSLHLACSEKVDMCFGGRYRGEYFSLGHCMPIYGYCDEYDHFSIETCEAFPSKVIYDGHCKPRASIHCPAVLPYHADHPACYHKEDHVFAFAACRNDYGICFSNYLFVATCPYGQIFDAERAKCGDPETEFCSAGWKSPRLLDDDLCWRQPHQSYQHLGPCNPHYVQCLHGQAHHYLCPEGEIFTAGKYCHYPDKDECYDYVAEHSKTSLGRSVEEEGSYSLELAELLHFCTSARDGLYVPDGRECGDTALFCLAGKASLLRCSPGHLLNAHDGSCVRASGYQDCEGVPSPKVLEAYLAKEACAKLHQGKFLLKACAPAYLHCHGHGKGSVQTCPAYQLFFAHLGQCYEAESSQCEAAKGHGSANSYRPPRLPLPCDSAEDGLVPAPDSTCSAHYFLCADGRSLAATCASGEVFWEAESRCLPYLHHPHCPHTGTVHSGHVLVHPETHHTSHYAKGDLGELHHAEHHSQSSYRTSGSAHLQHSNYEPIRKVVHRKPGGYARPDLDLHIDQGYYPPPPQTYKYHHNSQPEKSKAKVIDLSKDPYFNRHSHHRHQEYPSIVLGKAEHVCREGYKYPHPDSPSAFLVCRGGRLVTRLCGPRQHWDARKGHCGVFEEAAAAGKKCAAGAYDRSVKSCRGFRQCDNGVWKERPCPPGTAWSQALLTCDFAHKVHCH